MSKNHAVQTPRAERWGSSLGVVLAVAGSAVGLGNFLRFPGQVVNHGGGAFMIPYVISLLIIALPISMTEWAMGRCGGRLGYHSPLGIYYAVSHKRTGWGICGGLAALAPFVINMYYIFVESWCLLYALQYLGGLLAPLGLSFSLFPHCEPGLYFTDASGYGEFFGSLVGISENGVLFRSFKSSPLILATLICAVANFALVYCGIAKGIERFCKIAAPLIILCSIIVIIRVVTLKNPTGAAGQSFLDGLGFMWNPTRDIIGENGEIIGRTNIWQALADPETWLAATAQIFFTVSICLGAISTYASYIKPKDDIALSSLTATSANEFCEVVIAGFMTIPPAIMFLGVQSASNLGSSFSLGFVVLPNVFGLMPFGQFFGFVFFSLLFLAAITSSMSLVQPTVALFQESFHWQRGSSVILAAFMNFIGSFIVCWYTQGLVALDVFDFWLANFTPIVFSIIQTSLIVFVWKLPALQAEIDSGARVRIPRLLGYVVKYVSFPYLVCIAVFWGVRNLGDRFNEIRSNHVAQLSLGFFVVLIVLLTLLSMIVMKRWEREEARHKAISGQTSQDQS
ncbi:MAG: sodium:calcium symporter [Planctomycetia bacterium]|nr:sodium:calcium symporter [Planctomycetia bacterium]